MEFNITGIQAMSKKNPFTFQELRPTGFVDLVHTPENEYDSHCIEVRLPQPELGEGEYILLGNVPALKVEGEYVGSELQKHIIDEGITTAGVSCYGYYDPNTKKFNDNHIGHLQSVTLQLDIPENDSGKVAGSNYQRVTDFISYFDSYGGGDGLIRWACEQVQIAFEGMAHLSLEDLHDILAEKGSLFAMYERALNETAENGTLMHEAIENFLGGGTELSEHLPEGWQNFIEKYEIQPCYMEQRFYDNDLMVTGQPDLVCWIKERKEGEFELKVLDWKSSKKPSTKHKIQLSLYAKNAQWEGDKPTGAMVVCFGAKTKQRFSVANITRQQIESNYAGMKLVRQAMNVMGTWVNKYYEGE